MLDLSPKQKLSLEESNARLNFWIGAVRSGKSYVSLIRWLKYIQEAPEGNLLMVGKTASTIKHNIIDEICELIGADAKYYIGKNELKLWGKRIYLVACVDERSEQRIRGSTYAGAYVDELTLMPESFFTMMLSRLSIPGAMLFGTTNPDSPFHWLKKSFLDRSEELDCKTFDFILEDNPSLTEGFKTSLKQEYRGLWYRRYIDGEWCLAEGTIYDFFDESIHTISYSPGQGKEYYVGVDYGTTNPTAFVLLAYNKMHYPNMWIEKEYYYDSTKHNRQKTDSEYAADLKDFIEGIPINSIYVDPSASSFKLECNRQGIRNLMDADNEVLNGIRFVSTLLTNGTLKICKCCTNLIREFGAYTWDSNSKKLGVDKPMKANDHCFSGETLVSHYFGDRPIDQILEGDKVLTPLGYKYVQKVFEHDEDVYEYEILGQKIRCTKDHKFYTANRGWKKSSSLIGSDIFLINIGDGLCQQKSEYLMESSIGGTYPPKMNQIENTLELIKQIASKDMDICTETYGNSIMEKYPKECIFIMLTGISQTMILATSNVFQFLNMYPNIVSHLQKNRSRLLYYMLTKLESLQRNGMHQRKEEYGIEIMESKSLKKEVQKTINQKNIMPSNFVRINVSQNGEEIISLMMKLEYASFVIKNLESINIQKENVVVEYVEEMKLKKRLNMQQKNACIVKKHLELTEDQKQSFVQDHVPCTHVGKQKVYNLHVEDFHGFYVYNILTLNCLDSLRYCCHTAFGKTLGNQNRMTKDSLDKLKREAEYG